MSLDVFGLHLRAILISNDAWSFAVNQEEICKAAGS